MEKKEWPWLTQKATHLQEGVTSSKPTKTLYRSGKNTKTTMHLPVFCYSTLDSLQEVQILL